MYSVQIEYTRYARDLYRINRFHRIGCKCSTRETFEIREWVIDTYVWFSFSFRRRKKTIVTAPDIERKETRLTSANEFNILILCEKRARLPIRIWNPKKAFFLSDEIRWYRIIFSSNNFWRIFAVESPPGNWLRVIISLYNIIFCAVIARSWSGSQTRLAD